MIAIDSEFQSLIPPLSEDEYERLEKSILSEGVRNPIITWNGTIIDGHNRYHICEEHGIKCPQVEKQFASREAAKIWIIENQFGRRNLSPYDRSVLALKLEPLYAAEAKRKIGGDKRSSKYQETIRQKSDECSDDSELRTDEQLAKLAGTSRDTIRKVKVIETEAANGNETAIEARDAVKSGEKSINKAYTEIRPKICTICGKPIQEGDAYEHDANKHRACANRYHDLHRARNVGKFTDDGRRICTICGEPIDDGEAYESHPSVHKRCRDKRVSEQRYHNPDKSLLENVAKYSIETLANELAASVNDLRSSIDESLSINEGEGVRLTDGQKRRIHKAIDNVLKAIDAIRGE